MPYYGIVFTIWVAVWVEVTKGINNSLDKAGEAARAIHFVLAAFIRIQAANL